MLRKVIKRLTILVAIFSQLLAPAAFAKTTLPAQYETEFSQNDIVFYQPSSRSGRTVCGSGEIVISGDTVEEMIWSGLTSFMTEEQAAGVMGNMQSESGFNPARHEESMLSAHPNFDLFSNPSISYGIGLIQWSFGRRINVMNHIQGANSSLLRYFDEPYTYSHHILGAQFLNLAGKQDTANLISIELDFLKNELNTHASYRGIFNTTTVAEATDFFLRHVEIPRNPDSLVGTRTSQAQAIYDRFAGTTPGDPIGDGCEEELGNSIAEVAVKLAWPNQDGTCDNGGSIIDWRTRKSDCYDDIKPAYKQAVESLVGPKDLSYYQDCGHFASAVIRSSGADPGFPGGGTSTMLSYLQSHTEKWEEISNLGNTSNLQAGDVFVLSGHIMIYTGNVSSYGNNASASQGERTGNMGNIYFSDDRGSYHIFRLKGSTGEGETPDVSI